MLLFSPASFWYNRDQDANILIPAPRLSEEGWFDLICKDENISKNSGFPILHPDPVSICIVLKIEMENKLHQYVSLISILILIWKGAALMCILDPGPNSDYMKIKTDIEHNSP